MQKSEMKITFIVAFRGSMGVNCTVTFENICNTAVGLFETKYFKCSPIFCISIYISFPIIRKLGVAVHLADSLWTVER